MNVSGGRVKPFNADLRGKAGRRSLRPHAVPMIRLRVRRIT